MTDTAELISLGLDQLSEGFGIFDSDFRLVSCNRLYRDLRDYPDHLCQTGTSLESMIRFNAERGDFGPGSVDDQVAERLAEISDAGQREVEREMANGQILKIRYQHLESGGLTVTFEDKTEERRTQAALAASEERYALVSEAAEEAIYEWDIESERFYSSPQLRELLGIEFNQHGVRDWRWDEWIHPQDVEHYKATLRAHRSGELPRWECEYRIRNRHGEYRWISDHGTSIRNEDGHATRLIAAVRDITDRIKRNADLAASEERHALVAQATSDGLYDWDVVSDALHVTERLNELFEFDNTDTVSQDWSDRVHEDDLPVYMSSLRTHFKNQTGRMECEYRIVNKDGDYRWIRDRGIGVRNDDGRVVRFVGAVTDVTESKVAEEQLEIVEKRLLDSLEAISEGFLLVDSNDRVQIWNGRYLEIFGNAAGVDISDIVREGRPFLDMIKDGYERGMFTPHPGGAEGWIADRRRARTTPVSELEIKLGNGRWLKINERRMSDGGRVSVYSDITDFKQREEELDAARVRFEDAIEALSSGFALFDADDRIVVCNTKYREYFPKIADMVTPGTPFTDIIRAARDRGSFPESNDSPDEWLAALLNKRASASGIREQHLDGGLWLQVSDHRTKDGGIVSIYTDVTDLKHREAELRRQSAILEATLENMGQGISMVDENLNTVMFNKKFLEYLEFPEEDFKRGFHMSKAFRFNAERGEYGEGDIEQQISERLELSAKFLPHRFERTTAEGVTLEMVGNPIEAGGFVTTYTDITERKAAEQAIRDRETELSAVLDAIDYGIIFLGPDQKARVINRELSEQWGMSQEFIDGSPTMRELMEYNRHTGLYDVAPEDWEDWAQARVEAVEQGTIEPTDLRRADGRVLRYQCIALPDGGRMLTYFDITELTEREAELTSARDAAENALRDLHTAQDRLVQAEKMASLGQLTAGIAHEIKNPLNFVNNFAKLSRELLEELAEVLEAPIAALSEDDRDDAEDLFDTVKQNLTKIDEHGKRADSIVKNMLLHSRDGPSEARSSDLNAIAEEALNLAFHGARAENSKFNIEIAKSFSPDVGEIECFPQDMTRVFLNLISNGMYAAHKRQAVSEAAGHHQPTISLETHNHGDTVSIEVRDNGSGIPDDIRDKIFTPFFTTKPAGEGTGLGLSLSFDIVVKQHGGTMTVESEPEDFTAFTITLPRILKNKEPRGDIKA